MGTDTDLILNAIQSLQQDLREIRETQKEQTEKISDLCTRTALTDKEVGNVVQQQVKDETKIYKFISIFGTLGSGILGALGQLKAAGLIH